MGTLSVHPERKNIAPWSRNYSRFSHRSMSQDPGLSTQIFHSEIDIISIQETQSNKKWKHWRSRSKSNRENDKNCFLWARHQFEPPDKGLWPDGGQRHGKAKWTPRKLTEENRRKPKRSRSEGRVKKMDLTCYDFDRPCRNLKEIFDCETISNPVPLSLLLWRICSVVLAKCEQCGPWPSFPFAGGLPPFTIAQKRMRKIQ